MKNKTAAQDLVQGIEQAAEAASKMMGTYEGRTAAEWLAMAEASERRVNESWDRSDNDGFMSQWASGTMANEYRANARLAEQNGTWEFEALFDLEGNYVPAKRIESQYGWAYALLSADGRGRYLGFVNPSNAQKAETRRRNMEKKGYRFGVVRAKAIVEAYSTSAVSVGHRTVQVEFIDVEIVNPDRDAV